MITKTKLYCFVDESGQDTKGELFLVAVVLQDVKTLPTLEDKLELLEKESGKNKLKWKKTSNRIKSKYLESLTHIKELRGSIFYSTYHWTKEYSKLTSLTIAKAILAKEYKDYEVSVVIDGLNNSEREVVTRELKGLKIKYRKIRGMKDEQSVFLRLADTMAGFLRDATEKQVYTKLLMKNFLQKNIVKEA